MGFSKLLIAGGLGASFLACAPPPRPGEVLIERGPPPARVEVIAARPGADYVWGRGHWRWTGSDYDWVGGRWMASEGRRHWQEGQWRHRNGGWYWVDGRWR